MNILRTVVQIAALLLLGGGYFASQWAYWEGDPRAYARAVDVPSIQMLALALLVACIVLALAPHPSEDDPSSGGKP